MTEHPLRFAHVCAKAYCRSLSVFGSLLGLAMLLAFAMSWEHYGAVLIVGADDPTPNRDASGLLAVPPT